MTDHETIGQHIAELTARVRNGRIRGWSLQQEHHEGREILELYVELPCNHPRNGQDRFSYWEMEKESGTVGAADVKELLGEALADLAVGKGPKGRKPR